MRTPIGLSALALMLGLYLAGPVAAQTTSPSNLLGTSFAGPKIFSTQSPLWNYLNWFGSNDDYTENRINAPPPYQIDGAAYKKMFGIYRPQRISLN